jgi:hypothetical protein
MKIHFFIPVLFLFGCANVVAPTGGDKDSTPPQVVQSSPENESVDFSGRLIQIQFDEYVQLKDAFNQVIISPPLNETPDIRVKGKSILIEFKEALLDSTTYTIQFGESISDITEGNAISNYVFAFSTGPVIDSLTVSGTVHDLLTGLPAEKALVLLYSNTEDSAFRKTKPTYFTKVEKSGRFDIGHIRPGTYALYALEDQNFNYFYDLPNEKISFPDSILNLTNPLNNQNLFVFAEDNIPLFVSDARSTEPGQSRIILNKKATKLTINYTGMDAEQALIQTIAEDTIIIWHPDLNLKTHAFQLKNGDLDTTLSITLKEITDTSAFAKSTNIWMNAPPESKGGRSRLPAQELNRPLTLEFHRPITRLDTNLITLSIDSGKTKVAFQCAIDTTDRRKVAIQTSWIMDTTYLLQALPGAFTDILSKPNDTVSAQLETRNLEEYGILELQISYPGQHHLLIELLKKDGDIAARSYQENHTDTTNVNLEFLLPEVYKLRVTVDENKNGIWDTGNFMDKKQPEPIYFYPAEIKLRPNWSYGVDFKLKH